MDEAGAVREREAAIGEALRAYIEAVTGVRRNASGRPVAWPFPGYLLHLARLSAARQARRPLRAGEAAAAADALTGGATYPMLARAAGIARQTAWKRTGPADREPALPPCATVRTCRETTAAIYQRIGAAEAGTAAAYLARLEDEVRDDMPFRACGTIQRKNND